MNSSYTHDYANNWLESNTNVEKKPFGVATKDV